MNLTANNWILSYAILIFSFFVQWQKYILIHTNLFSIKSYTNNIAESLVDTGPTNVRRVCPLYVLMLIFKEKNNNQGFSEWTWIEATCALSDELKVPKSLASKCWKEIQLRTWQIKYTIKWFDETATRTIRYNVFYKHHTWTPWCHIRDIWPQL